MMKMKLNIQLFAATSSISCSQVGEPNIETNTSKQRITFKVKRTSGVTYWDDNKTLTLKVSYSVDGVSTSQTRSIQFNFPQGSVGATKSTYVDFDIPHNSDGTQNISYEATIVTGTSAGTMHPTGSTVLNTIPRKTKAPTITGYIESTINVVLEPKSSSFTHSLKITFGSISKYLNASGNLQNEEVKLSLPITFTMPTDFYNEIPNAQSGTGTIELKTYNGENLVGTDSSGVIGVMCSQALCAPTLNPKIIDVNQATVALTGDDDKLVKYKSNARVTHNATAKNGASISLVVINNTKTTNSYLDIPNVTTKTFTITATDSRGFTVSVTKNNNELVEYIPLSVNAEFTRESSTSNTVKLKYTGNYYDSSFGIENNTLSMNWKYRLKGETNWKDGGTITPTISNNKISGEITCGTNFSYQNNYEFILYFSDRLVSSSSGVIPVNKGIGALEVYNDGVKINGIFIGFSVVDEW